MAAPEAAATRWLGAGSSALADASEAGREAAARALRGPDAQLTIVFASDSYDLAELVAAIRDASGGVPLVGCSTAGEIATDGPADASVVVMALGGPGFSVQTSLGRGPTLREAGIDAAACAADVSELPHRVLLLLTDGLAGDQMEVVRGAYSVVGAGVPLVGGCAGDDLKMRGTHQLFDDEVVTGAVVAASIASEAPFGIGVRHGWRPVGEAMVVTRSEANRVHSLDDEPALDVYLRRLDAPAACWTDPQAFTKFALTHPLGISRRSGEEVRFVAEADFTDRSLGCIAQVPQGGLAWMMEGNHQSVLEATDAACAGALADLGGRAPIGMLAFDCIGRRGVLGEGRIREEIDRIADHALGSPIAGFYTYGEIARTTGVTGFHNQTLVVLAVA